jgi:thiopeptide-type bacteriocin biosynthesis protein
LNPLEQEITHSGFFAFRTPLLSFDELLKWSAGLESKENPQSISADRAKLRTRLSEIIGQPEIREAIFVASPDLDDSIELWLHEPESDKGQRTERALVRYFLRMAGRSTPFGLFAATSVGIIGTETKLFVADRNKNKRHTRLDVDYLLKLIDTLIRDVSSKRVFTYRPNTSLYRSADTYRYHESRVQEKIRSYHLVAVEDTLALSKILTRAKNGAAFDTLSKSLMEDQVSIDDVEFFLNELIESQILIPQIPFPIHGPEPLQPIIDELQKHGRTQKISAILAHTSEQLAAIDLNGPGANQNEYREIALSLQELPPAVDLQHLFQVDLIRPPAEATLSEVTIDRILKGVDILSRINRNSESNALKRFREKFTNRYESREVPLLEALDEESGVGFGAGRETSPLIHDLPFPTDSSKEPITWDHRDTLLLRKLSDALRDGSGEVELNDADLKILSSDSPSRLPDAFAVSAVLGTKNLLVDFLFGPSGARILGRFCHADPLLRKYVEQHLRDEEALHPDAIFAEIVHLPEGRMGNVLCRPSMRSYEIPYLGFTCAQEDHQLSVSDLVISVRGERIFLRSLRLNREIIPRMTNAHNFAISSLGVYRFLCELQSQKVFPQMSWSWGQLWNAPYLPRVSYEDLVLSRAQWRLDQKELKKLSNLDGKKLFIALQELRKKLRMPRWLLLADFDNRLTLDLENILCIESFAHLIKQRDEVILLEFYPGPDQLVAQGPEGKYVHELIVPFVRKNKVETLEPTIRFRSTSIQRSFPPGSEWLYLKLYTGTATADSVLLEIAPKIQELFASGKTDLWFFIRYEDPDWHLRIRFHGDPKALQGETLPALQEVISPLMNDGIIWRMQIDTYEREVERYGGDEGILLAERIFHMDSECAMEILALIEEGDEGLQERWKLTLLGMDLLLDDFAMDSITKLSLLKQLKEGLSKEFLLDKSVNRKFAEKFRKERKSLESLLYEDKENQPLSPGLQLLKHRSENQKSVISRLKDLEKAKGLSISMPDLVCNFLHMHANRLLHSVQREQELVLYDFLIQLYQSNAFRR